MARNNYKTTVAVLVVIIVSGSVFGHSAINKDKTAVRKIVDVELPMEQATR